MRCSNKKLNYAVKETKVILEIREKR